VLERVCVRESVCVKMREREREGGEKLTIKRAFLLIQSDPF
jgi:hypothetical protein